MATIQICKDCTLPQATESHLQFWFLEYHHHHEKWRMYSVMPATYTQLTEKEINVSPQFSCCIVFTSLMIVQPFSLHMSSTFLYLNSGGFDVWVQMYKSKIENLHAVSSSTLRCLGRLHSYRFELEQTLHMLFVVSSGQYQSTLKSCGL